MKNLCTLLQYRVHFSMFLSSSVKKNYDSLIRQESSFLVKFSHFYIKMCHNLLS
jgi:hypothetical protein